METEEKNVEPTKLKILVAVPSFNRPFDIMKRTGRWIKKLKVDWKIFIEPQQLKYYLINFDREELVTTATDIGVAGQVRYIAKYAKENGYDYVFKVDDDMYFKKPNTKSENSNLVVEEFFSECEQLLSEVENIGAITISKPTDFLYRYGIKWKRLNKTILGNYLVRTEFMELPEGLKLSDDMVIGVKVQQAGLLMYTYQFAYEDAISWKNKSGCQSFDRFKETEKDVVILKKLFPLIETTITNERADIDVSAYF